jgi:hypothetical protein
MLVNRPYNLFENYGNCSKQEKLFRKIKGIFAKY